MGVFTKILKGGVKVVVGWSVTFKQFVCSEGDIFSLLHNFLNQCRSRQLKPLLLVFDLRGKPCH